MFYGAHAARQPEQTRANVQQLVAWWSEGKLRPHVSSTYPLDRSAEALRELADRRAEGKVVVLVRNPDTA